MNTLTTFDPTDAEFLRDPYPALAELRREGPLVWHEPWSMWLATDHATVGAVLKNRAFGRLWHDWEPVEEMEPFNALHRNQLMENEPPAHTRMRRLLAGAFGRGHVERMRPRIEALAAEMVAALPDTFDVLADYAEPMPVYVICDLLGVPREDHEDLRRWSQAIVHMYEKDIDEVTKREAIEASTAFSDYVREVIAMRRAQPGEDLVSDLIAETDAGKGFSDDELVATVVLLLNAGHEASVNTFGNGFHALLTHRDQLARVTGGEVSIDTALEELIRFDAPLQLFERTATKDVEVAGQVVTAGQKVACLMGSANRDATVFEDADTFDVGRDLNPHVGFGLGIHFCLGAPLARLELGITLSTLLDRFPDLALVGEAPRRPTWVLRGYESIKVSA
ncbi:cytochrome P450 [Aeromicrobium duanguangcaii]|uniref:Cytochrome P450 n=1 Tax=Aeromicrobium duanguangcaii TaxID=2968086 RepID=A0ABY5KCJ3_9ACTN|nr:cytochrome P450 [Aeromicrobium duanguangcaii]MCD9155306.1 cytochrome P450 [Aeromicrobium duanguangcaii]MCL3838657.1 cytochrome P450 [Aeromicrobium duanguangcaii]UUI68045.1 cytochrome P450 [Aeromicrobium duanguangcaii]